MAIIIKNSQQIKKMRASAAILKDCFKMLEPMVKPGITTKELDDNIARFLNKNGAIASFKNYKDFPKSSCISINHEIVHGVPGLKQIKDGDIVSIDIGVFYDGYHSDAARTFACGDVSNRAQQLIDATYNAFFEGVKFARQGNFISDISKAIESYAKSFGLGIPKELIGHGIGQNLHEDPEIPNFWESKKRGAKLFAGMTLAIEPMLTLGTWEIIQAKDGHTLYSKDLSLASHYENTVLITDGEPEILTL